jgi:hypothetical protein
MDDKTPDIVIMEMPPIPREPFASDEDYARAVATSQARGPSASGSEVFIPEDRVVDALMALHANHHAVGMGVLHDGELTRREAEATLKPLLSGDQDKVGIDYLKGRPIKLLCLERAEGGYAFFSDLYNRDRPTLTAEQVIDDLLST